jgi:YVTN family beta-propeller protein
MERDGLSAGADSGDQAVSVETPVARTFLIVDVRGYTRFTQTYGDEEAGKLASRFAALVREAITGTGGEVLELRGDEALCVFSSARQALRAALELQVRFRQRPEGQPIFPLGVGIGLAAGEAVPVEGGYRGASLNLAARLCSLAGPGQILASETVTSLAGAIDGLRFVERRAVRVKGIERPVRALEVVPEVALPPVPEAPRPRSRRRGRILLAAGALVLAGSLAATLLAITRGSDRTSVRVLPNSVAVIDSTTSRVVDAIPVGDSPGPIAAGHDALWVINVNDRTLTKIDPIDRSIDASVGLPTSTGRLSVPLRLALTPDDVWVYACDLKLLRIDPDTTQIDQDLEVFRELGFGPEPSCAAAADASSVWVPVDFPRYELLRVADPQSDPASIAERIPFPVGLRSAITLGAGSVWVADTFKGAVRRVDPASGTIIRTITLTDGPSAMAFGHGAVWVANKTEDSVLRIRPETNSIVKAISVGADPVALAVGAGAIWVANSGDGTVSRIDPVTNTVTGTIRIGHRPLGVAVDDGLVWVTVRE